MRSSVLKNDLNEKKETEKEQNETSVKNKGVLNMGKMFGLGEIIISKIMEFIDTIFCLKNKLIKLESTNTPQVFEAFTSLNNCIRLSFICFIIFLIMNIYSIYNAEIKTCNQNYKNELNMAKFELIVNFKCTKIHSGPFSLQNKQRFLLKQMRTHIDPLL